MANSYPEEGSISWPVGSIEEETGKCVAGITGNGGERLGVGKVSCVQGAWDGVTLP